MAAVAPSKEGVQLELAVVILNYRTPEMVIDCLASVVVQLDPLRSAVVVVDNASGDDSIEKIECAIAERGWSGHVRLVASQRNDGFSAGNNIGIRSVHANAYLLLNSDTIVRPGAVAQLLGALGEFPQASIISPRLEWPDGTPQTSTFRYRSPASEFLEASATAPIARLLSRYEVAVPPTDEPSAPEWTSFAAVLLRRSVIDGIGEMDEGYFMYLEDLDYCRRARSDGWEILHWPMARVVHLRGGTSSVKQAVADRARPPAYYYRSRARYFAKFYGTPGLWFSNLCWWLGRAVSLTREVIGNKSPHTCEREFLDIWQGAWRPLRMPEGRGNAN